MKFMLNKQTGTFILREDMFDRISRQAKAEVGGEIAGERTKEKLEASKKASEFLNSIDRVRDNYVKNLQQQTNPDKPSYMVMLPTLFGKELFNNQTIKIILNKLNEVNKECEFFFTDIKNKKQVDSIKLLNGIKKILNFKLPPVKRNIKEQTDTSEVYLNTDLIVHSIVKNYIAFLINETLLNGLSDQDKINIFGDDIKFKNFQQTFSKLLMPTDEENKVYSDTVKKYNLVKNNLKTKSPEEAKQQQDQEQEEKRKKEEEREEDNKRTEQQIKMVKEYVSRGLSNIDLSDEQKRQYLETFKILFRYPEYILLITDAVLSGNDVYNDLQTNYTVLNEPIPKTVNFRYISNILKLANKELIKENNKLIKEYREEINNLLIPHMQKQLGFNHPPIINFAEDQDNAKDMVGKTGYYDPSTKEITVFITNRHPKDIMRTVAHEVIHHAQNERGDFDNLGEMGEGYFQTNPHLHKLEIEAYSSGNDLFRKWEENFRKQRNQNNMVNENNLRAKIRSLIEAEMKNMAEEANEPAKDTEHKANCECKECKTKNQKILDNKGLAESIDREVMPLKEWRNMELNSLLLNRFGIVSPQVLGEKKNKKPDADGDGVPDWADKKPKDPKVGAKKTPTKKGKVPPQFLKDKKKDESK